MEYISGSRFENENFAGNKLKLAEYEDCSFINCDFSGSNLSRFQFMNTEFKDCNLSNVKLYDTIFQEVKMTNCKLLGLQFDTCDGLGFLVNFDNCVLNHSVFYQMRLKKASFKNCQLQEVDFSEADLETTIITNCDLLGATFERTNLTKADLRESSNYTIDPDGNNIRGARFSLPEVLRLLDKYRIEIEHY